MGTYKYIAKNQEGQTITGVVKAENRELLIDSLHKKDLIIVSIKELYRDRTVQARKKKIKLDELVIFSRQLSTMFSSGVALVQALDILSQQIENPSFKEILKQIHSDIDAGDSLSTALSKHPKVFSNLYISMVKAGETSGLLDEILERLATYLEKTNALRRKVRSSLVYPAVVVSMAFLITLVLILKVIPTFKGIFETLGGELPLPTRMLIAFSDFLRANFLFGIASFVLLLIVGLRYISTERGRLKRDEFLFKLPIFGTLIQKVSIAKFARTLATLVKSGVAIVTALEIVGKTTGNRVIEEATKKASLNVREGEKIFVPLEKSGVFPPMVTRMISIGEQTGELEKMLTKIAQFYEEQVDAAVSGLTSLLEPIIIVFLGVVIGGIVIAMFMPIFKITQIIAH